MKLLILCLLSPLAASPALAATDDPDTFAVPDAVGVRAVPLSGDSAGSPPELPLALPEGPAVDDPPPAAGAPAAREAPRTTAGSARRAAPETAPIDLGPPPPGSADAARGATTPPPSASDVDLPLALPEPAPTADRAARSGSPHGRGASSAGPEGAPLALPEPAPSDRFGAPWADPGADAQPPASTPSAPRAAPAQRQAAAEPAPSTLAPAAPAQRQAATAARPAPPPPARAPAPPRDARPMAIPGNAPPPIPPGGSVHSRPAAIPGGAPPPPRAHPAPDPHPRDATSRAEPERRSAGAFVGAWADLTSIAGEPATAHGIEAGFHVGRALTLGVAGGRAVDGWTGHRAAFVGVRPGLTFTPDRPLSLQADVLLAIGAKSDPFRPGPVLPINVVEPRLGVGARLGSWGRLEAHVGYRVVPPGQPDAAALSAPTLGAGLRLGWF